MLFTYAFFKFTFAILNLSFLFIIFNLIAALSRYLLAGDSSSSWPMMMFGYLLVSAGNLIYCYSFRLDHKFLWLFKLCLEN